MFEKLKVMNSQVLELTMKKVEKAEEELKWIKDEKVETRKKEGQKPTPHWVGPAAVKQ
jgi:hypothetical protein